MIFDENNFGLGFLNSSSGPSYSDLFGTIEDTGLTIPPMHILTSLSIYVSESIDNWSTSTETVISPNLSFEGNVTSLTLYLPWWTVKMINVVGACWRHLY